MFDIDIQLRQGEHNLAVTHQSEHKRIGIFGDSGAGKSTLLRCLVGAARPTGTLAIGGSVWVDDRIRHFTPSCARGVGWMPQSLQLFPHLSVEKNLCASPRTDLRELTAIARDLEIADLLPRQIDTLSGGEAQRVALARALLCASDLLLIDEPSSNLDASRKEKLRALVGKAKSNCPMVLVSHDPLDHLALVDELLILSGGKVTAFGPPETLLRGPEENFFAAEVGGQRARVGEDFELFVKSRYRGQAFVGIHAHDIMLGIDASGQFSARNDIAAVVERIEETMVVLRAGGQELFAEVTYAAIDALGLRPGLSLRALIKASAIAIHPRYKSAL